MSLLKRKYLNELFETQDFRPATQKGQRSTCHHLHMAALTPIRSILTAAKSLGSQIYYKKSRMTILRFAGVLFCENEQAQTKWIIICSEENT